VKGLPILFSVHGRGEPVWLFAEKNGWDVLADETQAFVLVCPDSPGNIWQLERDGQVFGAMIDRLCADYGLDRTRVYLTGFSNGGAITREVGTAFPELFAAIAPSNAPVDAPGLVADSPVSPGLLRSGYELPYWVCVGDNDPAAGTDVDEQLEVMLEVNGCQARAGAGFTTRFAPDEIRTGENYYTSARGYAQGERFRTLVYCGRDGLPRVGYTVMKNMPHGAICEQSRAAWEFLRHFRRPAGSRQIEYLPG
jgi:poly(3-hydroxybutyrate) depolymerase